MDTSREERLCTCVHWMWGAETRGEGRGGEGREDAAQLTFSTNWILASIRKSLKTLFTLVSVP